MLREMIRVVMLVVLMALPEVCGARMSLAKGLVERYGTGWTVADSLDVDRGRKANVDSLLHMNLADNAVVEFDIQKARPLKNETPDFYLLVGLCFILGLIRYSDPRYFSLLIGAYKNPGSGRQWRELLQAANISNLGMNIFFSAVAGAYIYYISAASTTRFMGYRAPLVLLLMIGGMMVIYGGKYAVIRFSGWAFRVEELADQYLFNVFLVNKIIGIVLLPFVVVIAFAGREWVEPMAVVSGCIVIGLLATRYLRSWSAFYAFFKGSRFHFFTYLCASEILPMAVLVKWLLHLLR